MVTVARMSLYVTGVTVSDTSVISCHKCHFVTQVSFCDTSVTLLVFGFVTAAASQVSFCDTSVTLCKGHFVTQESICYKWDHHMSFCDTRVNL